MKTGENDADQAQHQRHDGPIAPAARTDPTAARRPPLTAVAHGSLAEDVAARERRRLGLVRGQDGIISLRSSV
jgi:hypothetical protein